jgi:periplasmic protein CpxP/Spy
MHAKRTLLALGLAALIAAPVTARAFGGGMGGHGGMGGPPMMMLLRTANLSSQQQSQVQQILSSNHAQIHALFQQLHSVNEQIGALLVSTNSISQSDFTTLETQKLSIQQQIDNLNISTALSIRGVLTSTQLSNLQTTSQKLQALHQQIEAIMGPASDNPPPAPQD